MNLVEKILHEEYCERLFEAISKRLRVIPSPIHLDVDSSNLDSVGYDSETKTLEITFHSGQVYQYYHVPKAIFTRLMNAASHGKFHHRNVKWKYNYKNVTDMVNKKRKSSSTQPKVTTSSTSKGSRAVIRK
jgi:hypothetical protein